MAEAVAAGVHEVNEVEAILKSTEQVTERDFLEASGIIAGSPVYFGSMAAAFATAGPFLVVKKQLFYPFYKQCCFMARWWWAIQ